MDINYRTQLPELLKHLGLPMIAVELGTAEGYNAKDFLENGIEQLTVVDNWGQIEGHRGDGGNENDWHDKNYADALKKLSKYTGRVTWLQGLSTEMAQYVPDNSVGMVYVDCDHSYLGVKNDIEAYWSKLVDGGVMAFHDYLNTWDYGVQAAVKEFAEINGLEVFLIPENKEEDAGAFIIKPTK